MGTLYKFEHNYLLFNVALPTLPDFSLPYQLGIKKDPSPEFLSFVYTQLEILPSPARGEGTATPGVKPTRPDRLTSVWEGRNL